MSNADPFITIFHQWIDVFMHRSMCRFIHYARKSGLSMSMIGALFHLERTGMTGVTDLGDHRVKQIVLTEKGCRVLEEGIRARQGWLIDLVDTLSIKEKEQIKAALNIMINKAGQLEETIQK